MEVAIKKGGKIVIKKANSIGEGFMKNLSDLRSLQGQVRCKASKIWKGLLINLSLV
jgi:hypothetical protein